MAEPAKKLDHSHPSRPAHGGRPDQRPRVVPMQRRRVVPKDADTWVLDQIVRWYQMRCE
jgi:hypothetical protein